MKTDTKDQAKVRPSKNQKEDLQYLSARLFDRYSLCIKQIRDNDTEVTEEYNDKFTGLLPGGANMWTKLSLFECINKLEAFGLSVGKILLKVLDKKRTNYQTSREIVTVYNKWKNNGEV